MTEPWIGFMVTMNGELACWNAHNQALCFTIRTQPVASFPERDDAQRAIRLTKAWASGEGRTAWMEYSYKIIPITNAGTTRQRPSGRKRGVDYGPFRPDAKAGRQA